MYKPVDIQQTTIKADIIDTFKYFSCLSTTFFNECMSHPYSNRFMLESNAQKYELNFKKELEFLTKAGENFY